MTAIIWKEIREHLKWAVLWLLAMSVAVAVILYHERAQSVCAGSFLGVLAFGGALGGALLALAQVLPEMRRGQWAFLVHRPATRTSVFLGKVIGGLLLYFPALGLPLLAATIWAATPGTLGAPFEARMVLPGVANILAGVLFYFAGLLTGLRPVRWYGSRALPLVAALPCLALVAVLPEFWMALLAIVVCSTILGLAAWGSFVAAGVFAAQPRRDKFALGVVLLAGIATAWFALVVVAAQLTLSRSASWTYYGIDAQGQILAISEEYGAVVKVTTPDGAEPPQYQDAKARNALRGHLLPTARVWPNWDEGGGYQNCDHYFFPLYVPGDLAWYYVRDAGRIQGYSQKDRHNVGSIGPEGFAPAGAAPGRAFPDPILRNPWSGVGLMAFPREVYRIDLPTQRVRLIFRAAGGQEILSAASFTTGTEPYREYGLAVATREELLFLETDGTLRFKVRHPCDMEHCGYVQVAATTGGERVFVWCSPSEEWQAAHGWKLPDQVIELAADGHELGRYALPATTPPPPRGPRWVAVLLAAGTPWPCLAGGLAIDKLTGGAAGTSVLWQGFLLEVAGAEYLPVSVSTVLLLLGFAAISAVLTLCLARRYAFRKGGCVGWTIAGSLLGPMGVLVLLALRDWPAREACPACGKMRVVDRDACEHCGAPFPAPVPDGTEIFESATM